MPDIVFSGPPQFGSIREQREIVDLVGYLLARLPATGGAPRAAAASLEMLSGGRSGAYIFKARRSGCTPVVVKIAPRDAGWRERKNYDQFVRPFLPAMCRPDLLGFVEAGDRAALCFSFVGDGDRPETLTGRLTDGDLTVLEHVLSTICEQVHRSWHAPALMKAEADLARYYMKRYFGRLPAAIEAEETLFRHASRYFDAGRQGAGYRIGEAVFPSVCGTLFGLQDARSYHSGILHGDLNSDNVVVDSTGGSARLIDFERTGRGHVLQDLVSLETSVRINYPNDASFRDILEIERSIAQGAPILPTNAYATAIVGIRALARRYCGLAEPLSNHDFAVAAVGLRLMRATDLSDAAQARISASALWAVKALLDA
ncbi:hypothetical protein HY78_17895 [Rhizorhabdus wittichii DC-6]|nr:hypothetical protein HY78_17895 [Rhizorhabdus wittichii DC-6]